MRAVRPDLIVVGDVMVDVSVDSGALARGGDVHGQVRLRPGGAGSNAAVWAAAAGAVVRLHGRVGDDLFGRAVCEALAARGVAPALAFDSEAPTGAMLVVRESGERSMVADRGANARLAPGDLPPTLDAEALLVSGYLLFDPGSEAAARAALERARAGVVAVDAASWPLLEAFGPERFFEATASATLLLANEREAETLSGSTGDAAASVLAERYPAVCVKLGERGAVMVRDGRLIRAEAPSIVEADPTGAGDAFDGTLLAALSRGASPEEALTRACAAGARAAASPELWP